MDDRNDGHAPLWWDENAACSGSDDADAWFVIEDTEDGGIVDPVRLALALSTCARCPIRAECERRARSDDVGIWGGMTTVQRKGN